MPLAIGRRHSPAQFPRQLALEMGRYQKLKTDTITRFGPNNHEQCCRYRGSLFHEDVLLVLEIKVCFSGTEHNLMSGVLEHTYLNLY